jgi:hypothetical protein
MIEGMGAIVSGTVHGTLVCQSGKSCQIWQNAVYSCVLNTLQRIKKKIFVISGTFFYATRPSHDASSCPEITPTQGVDGNMEALACLLL